MRPTGLTRRAAFGAGLALAARPASAAWPERPIRWVVGYAPGGGTDLSARMIGAVLAERLGQPIVVENRPGAATNIAAEVVAKSPPDGYTVFTADNGTLVYNPALFRHLPYDPVRDFRPVGLFLRNNLFLVVRRESPLATVGDFLRRARGQDTVSCASPGVGSPHHLTIERLVREGGLHLNHVTYRGGAPALNDLIAGTVETMVSDTGSVMEFLRAGRVRALAVCSAGRNSIVPDAPTMQEAGLAGFESYALVGLVVPQATPDEVVARLSGGLLAVINDPAVAGRLREIGAEVFPAGPERFAALMQEQRAIWVPLIESLGIRLD